MKKLGTSTLGKIEIDFDGIESSFEEPKLKVKLKITEVELKPKSIKSKSKELF